MSVVQLLQTLLTRTYGVLLRVYQNA